MARRHLSAERVGVRIKMLIPGSLLTERISLVKRMFQNYKNTVHLLKK